MAPSWDYSGAARRRPGSWVELRLSRVRGTEFVHGALLVGDVPGAVIFFGGHNLGILMLAPDEETLHYARFRAVAAPASGEPSRN